MNQSKPILFLKENSTTVTLVIYAAALWFFYHPYLGIYHDGLFYAGQALRHLYPDRFSQDLFFLYGSQDDFSLFSRLYAPMIQWIGLNGATLTLLLFAHALWLIGAVALIKSFYQGDFRWIALILLFAFPRFYGSQELFRFSEHFLTARIFAEAFSLLAIALSLRQRPWMSAAACAAAFLFHPIMAAPAVAYLVFSKINIKTASALSGIGLILIIVIGVLPQNYLPAPLKPMDDTWHALAVTRSPFSFIDQWSTAEYGHVLFMLSILAWASCFASPLIRSLSRIILLISITFLITSVISTITHTTILVQAQPWRVLWLTKIFAILAALWLYAAYWHKTQIHRIILLALALPAISTISWTGFLAPVLLFLLWRQERHPETVLAGFAKSAVASLLGVAFFISLAASPEMMDLCLGIAPSDPLDIVFKLFPPYGWLVFILPFFQPRWFTKTRMTRFIALLVSIELLIVSAWYWDRHKFGKENACIWDPGGLSDMEAYLPEHAVVYFQDSLAIPWLVLKRANYASFSQAAGLLFNRDTALEAERRLTLLYELGFSDRILGWDHTEAANGNVKISWHHTETANGNVEKGVLSFDGLENFCKGEPVDFLILRAYFPDASPKIFEVDKLKTKYYVYDCRILKK